jgi:hypothetical protein
MIARRADWKRAEQSAALSSRDCCGQCGAVSGVRHEEVLAMDKLLSRRRG